MGEKTLREAASERGLRFGAAVAADPLTDADYPDVLQREFDTVATENELKMGRLRPSRHEFDFEDAERIIGFAREHDMYTRGHTLVWHRMNPDWLTPWTYTDRQLENILREHVHTVAGRFRGQIDAWDVVNEAVADDGTMRESFWYRRLGQDFIDDAFRWANEVAPDAKLFYNDYGAEGLGEKSDAVYELVKGMLDRGVPIDGVGLQMHILLRGEEGRNPTPEEVAENIERLADLGLDVHITEFDVSTAHLEGDHEERLEKQAEYYRNFVQTALDTELDAFVTWGVADCNSWIYKRADGDDHPLLFDEHYQPKPAYDAVMETLTE